jgi:hypothetical protein
VNSDRIMAEILPERLLVKIENRKASAGGMTVPRRAAPGRYRAVSTAFSMTRRECR